MILSILNCWIHIPVCIYLNILNCWIHIPDPPIHWATQPFHPHP